MELKIKLDASFFVGFFSGLILSLVVTAASLGFVLGAQHVRGYSQNQAVPSGAPDLPSSGYRPSGIVPAGQNDKMSPSQGPDSAPVTIQEYADFHCHFCRNAVPTIKQLIEKFPGKIRREFHHFPLSETPGAGSFLTHEWAACAQEQGKFWEFHDAVFGMSQSPAAADLPGIGQKIGLNLAQLNGCVQSGKYRDFIKQERGTGAQMGVSGTPTFFINGQKEAGAFPLDHFAGIVSGILEGKPRPAQIPSQPQVPPPAPSPVNFDDLKGRPSKGPENAKIKMVEFSDFHCPFCKRVEPTLEEVEKNFPGQIQRIWRHYPLDMHAGARKTHEASECAFEQNKFWEYHAKLFATLGETRDEASLTKIAADIGLDKNRFEQCLKTEKYKERIQKDIDKGNQSGVSGTPVVFINGELVSGAQPYANFEQIIKRKLSGN